jgi:anti-sigma-K factor RskA
MDDRRIEEWPSLSSWRVRLVVAVAIVAACAASALVPMGWALEWPL